MKYFTIKELCRSNTADARGISNVASEEEILALTNLVDTVLDPLRELYGKAIKVNSGFRCLQLNRALGSKDSSHHRRGMAVDITGGSREENKRLFSLIIDHGLPFTQLIDESDFSWVHISYDPADIRMQVLKL